MTDTIDKGINRDVNATVAMTPQRTCMCEGARFNSVGKVQPKNNYVKGIYMYAVFHKNNPFNFVIMFCQIVDNFYRATVCEGGLGSRNSVRPSVRLSVTRVHCDKTK